MGHETTLRNDAKTLEPTLEHTLLGQCKCGYRHESVHQSDAAELAFHPFFCTRCAAVKAQLGLRKATPVCPSCQTSNVLSYGEEALTRPAQPGTRAATGVDASIAHFCPQCRNASLFFS
jgi:phage FluMu protein Com